MNILFRAFQASKILHSLLLLLTARLFDPVQQLQNLSAVFANGAVDVKVTLGISGKSVLCG